MNAIWPLLMLAAIVYAIATGNGGQVITWLAGGAAESIALLIVLAGTYCLWCGMLGIFEACGAMRGLAFLLSPVVRRLFPSARADTQVKEQTAANIAANMLGLGNAATPSGIKAMQAMAKHGNGRLTGEMGLFLVINCTSVQLIPTTLISLRAQAGSLNAQDILLPSLIVSCFTTLFGILCVFLRGRIRSGTH